MTAKGKESKGEGKIILMEVKHHHRSNPRKGKEKNREQGGRMVTQFGGRGKKKKGGKGTL